MSTNIKEQIECWPWNKIFNDMRTVPADEGDGILLRGYLGDIDGLLDYMGLDKEDEFIHDEVVDAINEYLFETEKYVYLHNNELFIESEVS